VPSVLDGSVKIGARGELRGRGIPVGRVGEPEDIARCALVLASDDASFIFGIHIVVDGGAMAPTA
jgi:NAD(P)-dependent dehydrogenase (short-subunit alcohol dehydrogenase family)